MPLQRIHAQVVTLHVVYIHTIVSSVYTIEIMLYQKWWLYMYEMYMYSQNPSIEYEYTDDTDKVQLRQTDSR